MCNKDMFDIDVINTYDKYLGLWICHDKLIIDDMEIEHAARCVVVSFV